MVKANDKMYDCMGQELTIKDVKDGKIHAIKFRESKVSSNNGRNVEIQKFKDDLYYSFDDLGILLFFNHSDYAEHKNLNFSNPMYLANKPTIEEHFRRKYSEEMDNIDLDKPIGAVLNKDVRAAVLKKVRSKTESAEEEKRLHMRHPNLAKAFGRIDLDTLFYRDNNNRYPKVHYYDRVYISKEPYERFDDIHMVNWRAPIAAMYYDNNMTYLKRRHYVDVINETKNFGGQNITTGHPNNVYEHELLLKRQYSEQNNTFKNLFLPSDGFFVDGSVDPFLLDVMRENRERHQIVDIIRTIQSNQNKIIRSNIKDNIVVQGCAGSGKTMILLHRLSYLLYNKMIINENKVKIITPNDNFSVFIGELAEVLELDKIPRITITDYYLSKLNEYGELAGAYKITLVLDISKARKQNGYDEILCTTISMNELQYTFQKKMSEILDDRDLKAVESVMGRLSIYYSFNSNFERLRILYLACSAEINSRNERLLEKIKENKKKLTVNQRFIKALETKKTKLAQLANEISSKAADVENIMASNSKLNEISQLIGNLNEIRSEILNQNKIINTLESEKESLVAELLQTSFINIRKKGKIRNRINSINDEKKKILEKLNFKLSKIIDLDNSISNDLITFDALIDKKLKELIEERTLHENDDASNESLEDILHLSCKEIENQLSHIDQSLWNKVKDMLYQWDLTGNPGGIQVKTTNFLLSIKSVLNIINSEGHKISEQSQVYREKEKEILDTIERINKQTVSKGDKESIDRFLKKLDNWNLLVQNIFYEFIQKKRTESNLKLAEGFTEKEVMLLLYLCFLYYGPIKSNDDFLFIDEGQDYSMDEYKLIHDVNGNKCVFNIFGDTNQLINSVGLKTWEQIDFLNATEYVLNENYRNTVEITEFVNHEFNYKLTAIGLNGERVASIDQKDIPEAVDRELSNNNRIAFICKDEKNMVPFFAKYRMNDKVSVFSDIKDVKGLEYDVVFVLPTGMTLNEKYIAYTRPLIKLYVIDDYE